MSYSQGLAQQQRDLLQVIFTTKNIATQATNTLASGIKMPLNSYSTRGLQTYQANAAASAQRSLQTAYPVIAQLIGGEAFEYLARNFWAQYPPMRGDLSQWGGELCGFIASIPALQNEAYLSDVAKAEWALHTATTAADLETDLTSFSLLADQDPNNITLLLAPGTALIHSAYPIASILTAHLYGTPNLEEVGQKLRCNTSEIALVWRQGLRPMVTACTAAEAVFLGALLADESLLSALENTEISTSNPPFDFQVWLPQAVRSGLLLAVR